MRRASKLVSLTVAAALILPPSAFSFDVTMPVNDSMGGPVTISIDHPSGGGGGGGYQRSDGPSRSEGGGGGGGGGGGEDDGDGALFLGMIIAAPIILVGGAFYVAGMTISQWLEARRQERERRQREEEERRRLEEEDRERVAAVSQRLNERVEAGRQALFDAATAVLDATAMEAAADQPFPYAEKDIVSDIAKINPKKPEVKDRENLYNADILALYKELWADGKNQAALTLITPRQFKAVIANESEFNAQNMAQCGYLVKKCEKFSFKLHKNVNVKAEGIGVGIASITRGTAAQFRVRVDATTDERLEARKALRGSLTVLVDYQKQMRAAFIRAGAAPDPGFLWELTLQSYNAGPYPVKKALQAAAVALKKPMSDLRMKDLRDGGFLKKAVGKNWESEKKFYLDLVRRSLSDDDPRKKEAQ